MLSFDGYLQKMASSGTYQVHDSLSCGVCFERFNSSSHLPKILPCQHTFCKSCTDNLLHKGKGFFECPVCRSKARSDEVRTNLVVIDIVGAVIINEKAKLYCRKHPAKECQQLVCIDCCQPLCAECVQGMLNGEHKGHTINDRDDAMIKIKTRLTTAVEAKIAHLEKETAAKIDKLAQYEQELNIVAYMITEALNEWKKTQLQTAQQVLNEELETSKAQQASWREKLQVSDLHSMATACKEAEKSSAPSLCHFQ